MQSTVKRHIEQLQEGLIRNLSLDFFDQDERDAIVKDIDGLDRRIRQKALALCFSLSHASSSLVPNTVRSIIKAAHSLSLAGVERWIGTAFDLLDSRGVDRFIAFISKTDAGALRDFELAGGLHLFEAIPVLEAFAQAISGSLLRISPHDEPFTDTFTLFLPPLINRYKERERNFFLYKLTVAYQWAQISRGTLTPDENGLKVFLTDDGPVHPNIETFFNLFADKELARDLYLVLEAPRLEAFLRHELPSLMRRGNEVKQELFEDRPPLEGLPEKHRTILVLREVEGLSYEELAARLDSIASLVFALAAVGALVSLAVNPFRMDRVPDYFPTIVQDAIIIGAFLLVGIFLLGEKWLTLSAVGGFVIGFALQDTLGNAWPLGA